METYSKTTVTKVTEIDPQFDAGIPTDLPGSNIPPASRTMQPMPSGGFHNQQELIASDKIHHDKLVTKDQAIPSPKITQERLHQGELLRSQSKKLSEVPTEDGQLHMPGAPCEPANGPDPIHEHSKPGLGAKIKGSIGQAKAWVNEKIHPVHPTKDAGVQQHYGIRPGQGLTQPMYQYSQYGPGASDLPPQPINKIDNLSTQTQAGDSLRSDIRSEVEIQPAFGSKLTLKEKAELASKTKTPVDLSELGLTNKPVVVKADLAGAHILPPTGFVETKNTYSGMPEEYKQEYFAKAGALQKEHITMAGKKYEEMSLGEKIKDTAAAGFEVVKEKAIEAKEYLDDKLAGDSWDTVKEKAAEAKEWVDETIESEQGQRVIETIKEKASDAKEWAEENITQENTTKVWETVKEKASDVKEWADEHITQENTSKAWETAKEKASDAKEWADDNINRDAPSKLIETVKEKASDAKDWADENITQENTAKVWETAKKKASDAKEWADENITQENTTKVWETAKKKASDAKEWADEKLDSENLSGKLSGKKGDSSTLMDSIKDKASEWKSSFNRTLSKDSNDYGRTSFDEAKEFLTWRLKEEKIAGERWSEKELTGWERWKPTGDRVIDMLEKKLRSEPEKSLRQREYEAAEHTREVKIDWGKVNAKDFIKDELYRHKYNDFPGFLKHEQ